MPWSPAPSSLPFPLSAVTDNAVFLGRLDHTFFDLNTMKVASSSWGLTGYANLTRNQAQGVSPTGTAAHAGRSTQGAGSLEGEYGTYFAKDYFADAGLDYEFVTIQRFRDQGGREPSQDDGPDRVLFGALESMRAGRGCDVSGACHWAINATAATGSDRMYGKAYSVAPGGIYVGADSTVRTPEDLAEVEIAVGYHSGSQPHVGGRGVHDVSDSQGEEFYRKYFQAALIQQSALADDFLIRHGRGPR